MAKKSRYRHAGRSTLPPEAQDRVRSLLHLGYGESFIVARLRGEWPTITREKVRTIRLADEGRTHHSGTVRDTRERVAAAAPLTEAAAKVAASWLHLAQHASHLPPYEVPHETAAQAFATLIARLMELAEVVPVELIDADANGGQAAMT